MQDEGMTPSGTLTEHAAENTLGGIENRLLAMLVATVHEVWDSVLVGNQAPVVAERWQRMSSPEIGDWVLVDAVRLGTDPYLRVGRWTGWWSHLYWFEDPADIEWAEQQGRHRYVAEEVFGLDLVDGRSMNWTNVGLLTIPPSLSDHMRERRP